LTSVNIEVNIELTYLHDFIRDGSTTNKQNLI